MRMWQMLISIMSGCAFLGAAGCGDGDASDPLAPIQADPEATARAFPQSIASGDPRATSVVLWTRLDLSRAEGDAELSVSVATDRTFEELVATRKVSARVADDYVVKVRIEELNPGTIYYYRFEVETAEGRVASRVGRTRTAPSSNSDGPARFAFFSCQDYKGRYYNAYAHLLETYGEDDLDFVVFLGDYIYEGASSVDAEGERRITFSDESGAIALSSEFESGATLAAGSLSNYRELYQQYRSDPMLQRLHERYPMIAIWDDHEFSDDSWQANGNYFAGSQDERSVERKRDAERAFFEYMPIDVGLGDSSLELEVGSDDLYDHTAIYRSFRWGAHLDLLLTDYRSFRPDHLIPEDAFPGAIAVPAGGAHEVDAYVDFASGGFEAERLRALALVEALYADEGWGGREAAAGAEWALQAPVSAEWLNQLAVGAAAEPLFDASELDSMPRGISFASLGKGALFSSQGSRYLVHQEYYHAYAEHLVSEAGGELPSVFGDAQEAWLRSSLAASESTWRVMASSVSLLPLMLDFTHPLLSALLPEHFPETFRQRFQLNSDQWDGFPLKKQELLSLLGETPNTVIVSGDIHSSFAGGHNLGLDGRHPVYELTGAAVSSATMAGFAAQVAAAEGVEGADALADNIGLILTLSATANPLIPYDSLDYTETASNGYVVVEVGADAVDATFHHYPSEEVFTSYYDDIDALMALFHETRFVIQDGQLKRE